MILDELDYIEIPILTGDIKEDIKQIYLLNNKEAVYNHVKKVAATNVEIAKRFNLDEKICEIAGLCHDIASIMKPDDMLSYVKNNNLYLDEAEEKYPFSLHQRCSAIIVSELFSIDEINIISSIRYHTTLREKATKYDMALFIADKSSWEQEDIPHFYDDVMAGIEKSLEHSSLAYINFIINNKLVLYPHSWMLKAKKWLETL